MQDDDVDMTDSRDILSSMFIPDSESKLVCDEKFNLSSIYANTINHHRDNPDVSENEKDADILSLLGVLHEDAIDNLQPDALKVFASAVYHYDGVQKCQELIATKKNGQLKQLLCKATNDINQLHLPNSAIINLKDEKILPDHVRWMSKEQLQMVLHRHYHDSDSIFRNTFGHSIESLQNQFKKVITPIPPENEKIKPASSSPDPPPKYLTVNDKTTYGGIDKMSLDNAYQEILRVNNNGDPKITMEPPQKKNGSEVMKEMKSVRDVLRQAILDPSTEFIISTTTDDNALNSTTQTQALFAVRQFAQQRRVLPDEKFLLNMSLEQLHSELFKIRDVVKAGTSDIPIPTLVRTRDGNKSKKELA